MFYSVVVHETEHDAEPCRPPDFSDPHHEPVNPRAWVRIHGTWRRARVSRWWRTPGGLVVHLVFEDGEMQRAGYFVYDAAAIRPGLPRAASPAFPVPPGCAGGRECRPEAGRLHSSTRSRESLLNRV